MTIGTGKNKALAIFGQLIFTLDIASVAYWYQSEPHKPFPGLPGRSRRMNMPEMLARRPAKINGRRKIVGE